MIFVTTYERINNIRKSKGVKWTFLNENIPGAYHGRMTDFKNGKTTLSNQQLEAAADILGTTIDYLLGRTDDPTTVTKKEKPAEIGELSEEIGPAKRELLDMVGGMNEKESAAILEVVKATIKMRDAKE